MRLLTAFLLIFTVIICPTPVVEAKNPFWRRIASPLLTYAHWVIFASESLLNAQTIFEPNPLKKLHFKSADWDGTDKYMRNHILSPIGLKDAHLLFVYSNKVDSSASGNVLLLGRLENGSVSCSVQELARTNKEHNYESDPSLPNSLESISQAIAHLDNALQSAGTSLPQTVASLKKNREQLLAKKDYVYKKAALSAIIQHEATHSSCRNDDVFNGTIVESFMPFMVHGTLKTSALIAKKLIKPLPSLYNGLGIFLKIPTAFGKKILVDAGYKLYRQHQEWQADEGIAHDEDTLRVFSEVLRERHERFAHFDEQDLQKSLGATASQMPLARNITRWFQEKNQLHPPLIQRSIRALERADALKAARMAKENSTNTKSSIIGS